MERSFSIDKDYYGSGESLYKKTKINFDSGVTVLVGCNGSGKTTLMRQMKEQLKKDEIPFLSFDNLTEGGDYIRAQAGYDSNFQLLAQSLMSSEGENINIGIGLFARKLGNYVRKFEGKELWIFLDAIDSGFSIDNICETKELFDLILSDCKKSGITLYIVVTANSFEMARNNRCLDVYMGIYRDFETYDTYRKFILESRKRKEKRT